MKKNPQKPLGEILTEHHLVGGLNPFQKYESKWIISPKFQGEHEKIYV